MGSAKEELVSQSEELPTPEAARPPAETGTALPGAETVPRRCTALTHLVPWWALLAVALLVAGIVGFALKGKDAADLSTDLFSFIDSGDAGLPKLTDVFKTGWAVTVGVSSGLAAASLLLAAIRVNQKLRRAGMTKEQGAYGKVTFRMLHWLCIALMLFAFLTCTWVVVNLVFLTSWGLGLRAVRDGSAVAMQTLDKVADFSSQYSEATAALEGVTSSTLVDQLAKLGTFSPMLVPSGNASLLAGGMVAPWLDSVCPSVGCLNLALYGFLESSKCVCTKDLLTQLNSLASEASTAVLWSTGAAACLSLGAWLVSLQFIAGINLMATDQLWLRVVRKKAPSSTTSSGRGTTPTMPRQATAIRPQPGATFTMEADKKQFLAEAQRLASAARRLPYSTPPVYNVRSDSRATPR
ncbi:hypothetical protein N2152v2_007443 [Parachlorella kessleri]